MFYYKNLGLNLKVPKRLHRLHPSNRITYHRMRMTGTMTNLTNQNHFGNQFDYYNLAKNPSILGPKRLPYWPGPLVK